MCDGWSRFFEWSTINLQLRGSPIVGLWMGVVIDLLSGNPANRQRPAGQTGILIRQEENMAETSKGFVPIYGTVEGDGRVVLTRPLPKPAAKPKPPKA